MLVAVEVFTIGCSAVREGSCGVISRWRPLTGPSDSATLHFSCALGSRGTPPLRSCLMQTLLISEFGLAARG